MNPWQDAALRYADLGYPVFPCLPDVDPKPLTPDGFYSGTTDLDEVETHWYENPVACIGVAAGGLLILDVDSKDNPWLAEHPDRARSLLAAPTSITPSGGRHHYFRLPPGKIWRCSVKKLAPNVDIRTDGGYAILPPSERKDGKYKWVEGCELEVPPDKLPLPPKWLCDALDLVADKPDPITSGAENPIPTGQRNNTLARLGGNMRRFGMSRSEISAALQQTNTDRCRPPLDKKEVERIAASIAGYRPDEVSTALAENHFAQLGIGKKNEFEFVGISTAELFAGNFDLDYLIDGVLVKGQPGVIAGPKKCLKTNVSVDLTLSLSTGTPFLGRFPVARQVKVGMMSGESGAAVLKETAVRIARSKGLKEPPEDLATWCFNVPQLTNFYHLEALKRFIEKNQLDVLILDPTYLMLAGIKDDASNMFSMGPLLKNLGDLSNEFGCTPILCHHFKKTKENPFEPAELEDIAWAGFQEYVRQWFLQNRRIRYEPDRGGHHELWFQVGGSAGHSGMWGLNIDEGTRQTPGGRYWDVNLSSASEAREDRDETVELMKEARKQKQQEKREDKGRQQVIQVLRKYPEGETVRTVRNAVKLRQDAVVALLDALVEDGTAARCTVMKHTREEVAYRLI